MNDNPINNRAIELIDRIRTDNRAGAAEILREASSLFSLLDRTADPIGQVRNACARLIAAQPEMAPLANLARVAYTAACTAGDDQPFEAALAAAERFSVLAAENVNEAARHAAMLIPNGAEVLIHSRSSTVLAALRAAKENQRRFNVTVTESRPALEGRDVAASLAGQGLSVTVVIDAAAAAALTESAVVILGADRVTPGAIINKAGTGMIALAARERAVPVYLVSDTSKFIDELPMGSMDQTCRNPAEIWEDPPEGVSIKNIYFEKVPLSRFDAIITEAGAMTPEQAANIASGNSLPADLKTALEDLLRRR